MTNEQAAYDKLKVAAEVRRDHLRSHGDPRAEEAYAIGMEFAETQSKVVAAGKKRRAS